MGVVAKPCDKIEFGVEDQTYEIRDVKLIEHSKWFALSARRRGSHPDHIELDLDPAGVLELQGASGLLPRSERM